MNETKSKRFSVKKTFACREGGKKAQKQSRDDTIQKKTNVQVDYATSVPLYTLSST